MPKRLRDLPKIPRLTSGRTLIQTLYCLTTKFPHFRPYHPACLIEIVDFLTFLTGGTNFMENYYLSLLLSRSEILSSPLPNCLHSDHQYLVPDLLQLPTVLACSLLPPVLPYNQWGFWNVDLVIVRMALWLPIAFKIKFKPSPWFLRPFMIWTLLFFPSSPSLLLDSSHN